MKKKVKEDIKEEDKAVYGCLMLVMFAGLVIFLLALLSALVCGSFAYAVKSPAGLLVWGAGWGFAAITGFYVASRKLVETCKSGASVNPDKSRMVFDVESEDKK